MRKAVAMMNTGKNHSTRWFVAILATLPMMAGCSEDVGSLQIFVEPEDSIGGIGSEYFEDGWAVSYDEFLVSVGNARAARTDTNETLKDASAFVLDLKRAPTSGYLIAEMNDVSAGAWHRFGFDLPNAKSGMKTLAPTTAADVDMLVQNGYSLYFEGAIEKADGKSCPPGDPDPAKCVAAPKVTFRWGLAAGTSFDDCATVDGIAGFAIPAGGATQIKPTIHGDHWFFNDMTAGAEIVERRAQYIADCDLNHDGETTLEELKQVSAAEVFPSPMYDLSGSFSGPIETAYDYVLAQARTLGDFQGDGECPTRKVLP